MTDYDYIMSIFSWHLLSENIFEVIVTYATSECVADGEPFPAAAAVAWQTCAAECSSWRGYQSERH